MAKVGTALVLLSHAYVYFISFERLAVACARSKREEKQKFCWEITGIRD